MGGGAGGRWHWQEVGLGGGAGGRSGHLQEVGPVSSRSQQIVLDIFLATGLSPCKIPFLTLNKKLHNLFLHNKINFSTSLTKKTKLLKNLPFSSPCSYLMHHPRIGPVLKGIHGFLGLDKN